MIHEEVLIAFSSRQYLFINFCSRWLSLLLRDFTLIEKLKQYTLMVSISRSYFIGSHSAQPDPE